MLVAPPLSHPNLHSLHDTSNAFSTDPFHFPHDMLHSTTTSRDTSTAPSAETSAANTPTHRSASTGMMTNGGERGRQQQQQYQPQQHHMQMVSQPQHGRITPESRSRSHSTGAAYHPYLTLPVPTHATSTSVTSSRTVSPATSLPSSRSQSRDVSPAAPVVGVQDALDSYAPIRRTDTNKQKHSESENRRRARLRMKFTSLQQAAGTSATGKKDRYSILQQAIEKLAEQEERIRELEQEKKCVEKQLANQIMHGQMNRQAAAAAATGTSASSALSLSPLLTSLSTATNPIPSAQSLYPPLSTPLSHYPMLTHLSVCYISLDGRILDANRAFCMMFGFEPSSGSGGSETSSISSSPSDGSLTTSYPGQASKQRHPTPDLYSCSIFGLTHHQELLHTLSILRNLLCGVTSCYACSKRCLDIRTGVAFEAEMSITSVISSGKIVMFLCAWVRKGAGEGMNGELEEKMNVDVLRPRGGSKAGEVIEMPLQQQQPLFQHQQQQQQQQQQPQQQQQQQQKQQDTRMSDIYPLGDPRNLQHRHQQQAYSLANRQQSQQQQSQPQQPPYAQQSSYLSEQQQQQLHQQQQHQYPSQNPRFHHSYSQPSASSSNYSSSASTPNFSSQYQQQSSMLPPHQQQQSVHPQQQLQHTQSTPVANLQLQHQLHQQHQPFSSSDPLSLLTQPPHPHHERTPSLDRPSSGDLILASPAPLIQRDPSGSDLTPPGFIRTGQGNSSLEISSSNDTPSASATVPPLPDRLFSSTSSTSSTSLPRLPSLPSELVLLQRPLSDVSDSGLNGSEGNGNGTGYHLSPNPMTN